MIFPYLLRDNSDDVSLPVLVVVASLQHIREINKSLWVYLDLALVRST